MPLKQAAHRGPQPQRKVFHMNINDCLEQMSAIHHKLGAIESQQKSLLLEVKRLYEELKRIQYDDPDWSNTALRWEEAAQEKDVFYDGDGKIIVTVADCQPDSQFCEERPPVL